jgi:type IV secretory pathway VirB3-like protein
MPRLRSKLIGRHSVKITRGDVRVAVGTSPFLWLVPLPPHYVLHPPQIRHFKLGRDIECTSRIWRGNSYSSEDLAGRCPRGGWTSPFFWLVPLPPHYVVLLRDPQIRHFKLGRDAECTSRIWRGNSYSVKIARGDVRVAVPLPSHCVVLLRDPQIRHFKLGRDAECTSRIWRGNSYSVNITRGDVRKAVGTSPFFWLVPLPPHCVGLLRDPQIRHFKLGRDAECTSRIWRGN